MKYILKNVNLIDGTKDCQVQEGRTVVVEDGRIRDIWDGRGNVSGGRGGADTSEKGVGKVYDLSGKYLMPGLVNLHTHLAGSGKPVNRKRNLGAMIHAQMGNPLGRAYIKNMCYKHARTALMSGVTTLRCVGGLGNVDGEIRDEINVGKRVGPRLLVANLAVSVPEGHMAGSMASIARTPKEAAEHVREVARSNPDFIKLMVSGGVLDANEEGEPARLRMSPEMVRAACEVAHELGYAVAAHAESTESVRVCLKNGVDTIEHGAVLDDEMLCMFRERGAAFVETLSPSVPTVHMPWIPTTEVHRYNGGIVNKGIITGARQALEHGVPVGLGNDTGCKFVTHYNFWRELVCFHKQVGASKSDAIYHATYVNAQILGLEKEIGSIEAGKCADMVVLDDNPLEDLWALEKPRMVIARGDVIEKPSFKQFDEMDEELEKAYRKWR